MGVWLSWWAGLGFGLSWWIGLGFDGFGVWDCCCGFLVVLLWVLDIVQAEFWVRCYGLLGFWGFLGRLALCGVGII